MSHIISSSFNLTIHRKILKLVKFKNSNVNMTVLPPNDFLVLERYNGTVQRIVNGIELEEPVLDVNVAAQDKIVCRELVRF
jgi:hypothetical protein